MKKFMIGVLVILLVSLGSFNAVYRRGVYLDLHPDAPISVRFRTEGRELLRQGANGIWEPFCLRGVDVLASMPGHPSSDFAPSEEDYLRWFLAIGEMGANTLRAATIMDDEFYDALYSYNTTHAAPLYLLQGIQVSDAANQGTADAYDEAFLGKLLEDGRSAVDVIHGRKDISASRLEGGGSYRRDVSPWVMGYLVGHAWDSRTVAYTDHSLIRSGNYQGRYFSTAPEATPFEAMLAQVMDTIVDYESSKYKEQRLIAFANDPANDPFLYDPFYAAQLSKYNQVDAEHILPAEQLLSGYFAAYRLYDFCPDLAGCFSAEQVAALGERLTGLDTKLPYGGYLELLSRYHTMPLVAVSCGVSSARGAVAIGEQPRTERQQGEALLKIYDAALTSGWAGMTISSWQDSWERTSWNTAFATDLSRSFQWHDLQTEGQNYGIMAYVPGETERICLVDGDSREWTEKAVILREKGLTLSACYDPEGLYLLIQGEKVGAGTPLYLPIDVTEKSGSFRSEVPAMTFDRAADFLLCVNGERDSRLLVQERYDATRENFLFEISGEDPFVSVPAADSSKFVPVTMALGSLAVADHSVMYTTEELRRLRALGTWETGSLRCGSADPASPDFDSLADLCFGEDCVELRLPWRLLNFYDPSTMGIHDDYYLCYGVERQPVRELWIGVGDESETIVLSSLPLRGWGGKIPYHERLKESYGVLRARWTEEAMP